MVTKAQREELRRLKTLELYRFMEEEGGSGIVVGVDEVGRGPLAGPLTVAAVVLPPQPVIVGLDDSKKQASAFGVAHIEPAEIDACGMAASLRVCMTRALRACGVEPDCVLLDGNPMNIHPREKNIVKGDGKAACIAAASILAKVTRDRIMEAYDAQYPQYGFASNKGYGSAAHIAALREHGPCPLHRMSFLGKILAS